MKELHDIIQAYDLAVLQGKKTVLATVVKVVGSSYRRPGARMLVTEDGQITGAISGGCLEGDALRKAMLALIEQKNKLAVYDTTDEDDAKLGVQLGCNGIVYILFEPIVDKDENNPIQLLKRATKERRSGVLVTIFNEKKYAEQKGTCCFISDDESLFKTAPYEIFKTESKAVLQQKLSVVKDGETCSTLYQFIPPLVQLVIAGAGNDAQPLVEMAAILSWHTMVVDGRSSHATTQRFPKAHAVLVAKPEQVLSKINTDEHTAFVLMTHNYNFDLALLARLLTTPCAYIGVLGPRKKLQRMLNELHQNQVDIHEGQRKKIYGPVGLDIGAETAEEIALSVIAEIKSVLSRRNVSSLKDKSTAIHERIELLPNE